MEKQALPQQLVQKTGADTSSANPSAASTANSSPLDDSATLKKRNLDEFILTREIGMGAYGTVYLGKDKLTDKMVAVKSVNKEQILRLDKKRHVYREKTLLTEL